MSVASGIVVAGFILVAFISTVLSEDDFPYPKDAPRNVKDCRNVIFNCDCGNPGYKIQAVVKQCHFWMPPEQACTRFQHCLECEDGQDKCVTCPPGRYGRWCNADCNCQNGGTCNKEDGSCRCAEGYEGENCETRAEITRGEVNCQTKGTAVMGKPGVLVKITCPPGCRKRDVVWGTSIYTEDSSVCAAAIHAGFLNEEGGVIYLINNGPYSNFLGSSSNRVPSQGRSEEGKSFKFSKSLEDLPVKKEGCPNNWLPSNEFCVLAAKPEKAWELASCSS